MSQFSSATRIVSIYVFCLLFRLHNTVNMYLFIYSMQGLMVSIVNLGGGLGNLFGGSKCHRYVHSTDCQQCVVESYHYLLPVRSIPFCTTVKLG